MSRKYSPSPSELLEKQNEKLRNQIKGLKLALESISSKKQNACIVPAQIDDQDKELKSKLVFYKAECQKMKKELEGNPNIPKITDLENESKYLIKKIEELEKEKANFLKFDKMGQNALQTIKDANSYPEKIHVLKNQIMHNREKIKELTIKVTKESKDLKAQHERCVDIEHKSRKLFELIKNKKKEEEDKIKTKNTQDQVEINEFLLKDIQDQIILAEKSKQENEDLIKSKIKNLETNIFEKRHFIEMFKVKLKEKEQEFRLSLMRISESKKLVKYNQPKQLKYRSGNSTPRRLELSPINKDRNEFNAEKNYEHGEIIKRSTNQKVFHQETLNKLQANIKSVV